VSSITLFTVSRLPLGPRCEEDPELPCDGHCWASAAGVRQPTGDASASTAAVAAHIPTAAANRPTTPEIEVDSDPDASNCKSQVAEHEVTEGIFSERPSDGDRCVLRDDGPCAGWRCDADGVPFRVASPAALSISSTRVATWPRLVQRQQPQLEGFGLESL